MFRKVVTVGAVIAAVLTLTACSNTSISSGSSAAVSETAKPSKSSTPTPTAIPIPEPTLDLPKGEAGKIEFAAIADKSYQKAKASGLMEYRSDSTFIGVYDPTVTDVNNAAALDNASGKYKILRKPDGNFIVFSTQMNLVGIDKGYVLPPEASYSKQGDGTWLVETPSYVSEGWEVPASSKVYILDADGLISKVLVRQTSTMPAYSVEIFYNVDDFGKSIIERARATAGLE